jgi:Protein of unknown function (DUF3383)
MPSISQVVQTVTTRTSTVATLPGFGVPGVLCQFTAGTKGFTASGVGSRTKTYTSTASMISDGWAATDSAYLWANTVFSQNPKVPKILVGRIDSGDASVAASGAAIRAGSDDWYAFEVVGNRGVSITLSTPLSASNVLASTVNGIAITGITYATSHAATMAAWETAIETALGAGAVATVSGNTMTIVKPGLDLNIATAVVTGGTVVTATITYPLDAVKTKDWMAWAETQKKMIGVQDSDPATMTANTGVSGTACLAEYAMLLNYERTFCVYHADNTQYLMGAWIGDQLPYDPGVSDWSFKSMAGVSTDNLTSSQDDYIRAKNCNVYVLIAGISSTYAGQCAKSARYIDDQRFIDWQDTQIALDYMTLRAQALKIPRTTAGYQMVEGTIKGSLAKGVKAGGTVPGTDKVTMPLPADASSTDIANRTITGIVASYTLSGSVNNIQVNVQVAG